VKSVDEYDGDSPVCRACLTAPAPRKKAAPVTRTVKAAASPVPDRPRTPLTGTVGSGDLEARERRAKRTAWEQLAELHAEEYDQLLQVARRAEGLRT
jgi:mRNA-degrading endonuclease toxin of MazEF toxin-antitoxin module